MDKLIEFAEKNGLHIVWPDEVDLSHIRIAEKQSPKASEYFVSSIKELLEKYGFEIYGDLDGGTDDSGKDILILKIRAKDRPFFKRTIFVRDF